MTTLVAGGERRLFWPCICHTGSDTEWQNFRTSELSQYHQKRLHSKDDIERVTKKIMVVYQKKSYLQEFCVVLVGRLISDVGTDVVRTHIVPHLGVECGWDRATPETIYLLLTLQQHHGKARNFTNLPNSISVVRKNG